MGKQRGTAKPEARLRALAIELLMAGEDLYERVTQEHTADHRDGFTDKPPSRCLTCKVLRGHDRLLVTARKKLDP